MSMRRLLKIALATAAIGLGTMAAPAYADIVDNCHDGFVTVGGQGAIACVGYYDDNAMLTGQAGQAPSSGATTAIQTLLSGNPSVQDSEPGYVPPYDLDVDTILDNIEGLGGTATFTLLNDTFMSGLTVLGVHWGNNGDSTGRSITAFYLFNLTGSSDTITLGNNGLGSSNAQLYATGGAVPEPATWAMMLLGFGGIGFAMRRGRKESGRLLQIA